MRRALVLRRAVVIVQKATHALTPPNEAGAMPVSDTVNEVVAETLMVPLAMVVDQELGDRLTEVPLTERKHAIQAFFLD